MLRAADILLLNQRPSVTDMALPSKLAAYFASGRPVVGAVASQSSAGREIAISGAGVVVEPGRPLELARVITRLQGDLATRSHLGSNGRAYAEGYLQQEQALTVYDRFLWQLASSESSPRSDAVAGQ
jgi:glycosyltransferase involved in cell wall biosynthesis